MPMFLSIYIIQQYVLLYALFLTINTISQEGERVRTIAQRCGAELKRFKTSLRMMYLSYGLSEVLPHDLLLVVAGSIFGATATFVFGRIKNK